MKTLIVSFFLFLFLLFVAGFCYAGGVRTDGRGGSRGDKGGRTNRNFDKGWSPNRNFDKGWSSNRNFDKGGRSDGRRGYLGAEQTKRLSPLEKHEKWRAERTPRESPSEKVERWHRTYRKEQVERERRREEDRREYWNDR